MSKCFIILQNIFKFYQPGDKPKAGQCKELKTKLFTTLYKKLFCFTPNKHLKA